MLLLPVARRRYRTGAVIFDGANDYLTRGAGLTGAADGQSWLMSFWINFQGGNGSRQSYFGADNAWHASNEKQADNTIRVQWLRSGGSDAINIETATTYTDASGWLHFIASGNGSTAHLYINGSDDQAGGGTVNAQNIDFTRSDWFLGALAGGSRLINAYLADFYFALEYLDISQAANLAKFISNGKPVDLGADGSEPTGTTPIVFLRRAPGAAAATFATNLGSGGDFSVTGALASAPSSPSD